MNDKKIAVVILNYNGKGMLERFLPSVVEHSSPVAEVIVADNGSSDDSISFLKEHYPELRRIEMDQNYWFAGGYDKALSQVEADYYVLLNSDVEVTPHWIEPVVEMMEKEPKMAIAQPKLRMFDKKELFEYAGGAGGFIDKNGYPFCRGRIFDTLEEDHGQYDDECDIFWATGAAMFVKASVWKELGGLDADFKAHMEEIDFCWRSKNKGYRVGYCPKSVVFHVGGGTLPKSSPTKTFLNFRNNMMMLFKNLPPKQLLKVMRLRTLLDRVAALKFLASGSVAEYRMVAKARKEFKEAKDSLLSKRTQINPQEVGEVYQRNLLLDYYLFRKKNYNQLKQDKFTNGTKS